MKINICKLIRPAECHLRLPIFADAAAEYENLMSKPQDSPDALCGVNVSHSFSAKFKGRYDYIKYDEIMACPCRIEKVIDEEAKPL